MAFKEGTEPQKWLKLSHRALRMNHTSVDASCMGAYRRHSIFTRETRAEERGIGEVYETTSYHASPLGAWT